MKSSIQKSRQSSVIFKKPDILFKNLITFTSPTTLQLKFFAETLHMFPTSQHPVHGIFFILFKS